MIRFYTLILIFPGALLAQALDEAIESLEFVSKGPEISCPADIMSKKCRKKFDRLHKDGELNITYAFGYGDNHGTKHNNVWSDYWANKFKEDLISNCPTKSSLMEINKRPKEDQEELIKEQKKSPCGQEMTYQNSCGFKRTDDPEIFEKKIKNHLGKETTVKLRLVTSHLSSSDKDNRASTEKFISEKVCPKAKDIEACVNKWKGWPEKIENKCTSGDELIYQVCKTAYARRVWENSIMDGDEVVVYDGHARDGGGPSFGPPKTGKSGDVNYNYYHKNREGHDAETRAFQLATKKGKVPVYYGSMSCSSRVHFYSRGNFPEASPATTYALANRTSFTDEGRAASLTLLNGILGSECEEMSKKMQGASCAFRLYND